jgi:hypothetical protein
MDALLGYTGVTISIGAINIVDSVKFWIPWTLGVALTVYTLYNQYMTAKINRKKYKKFYQDDEDSDYTK